MRIDFMEPPVCGGSDHRGRVRRTPLPRDSPHSVATLSIQRSPLPPPSPTASGGRGGGKGAPWDDSALTRAESLRRFDRLEVERADALREDHALGPLVAAGRVLVVAARLEQIRARTETELGLPLRL